MPQLESQTIPLSRDAVLRRLETGRPDPPSDPESFGDALRRTIMANVIRIYGGDTIDAPRAAPDESPSMWLRMVNHILRTAGAGYAIDSDPDDPLCHVCVRELGRDSLRTEYGAFLPAHVHGIDEHDDIDWPKLVETLADLHFLESVHYKVSRLSVVADPALYPFWIVGRRRLRRLRPVRPEVGVHYRFLQEFTPRREARLYRLLTPRWEVRRDRVAGLRRWGGRRTLPSPLAPRT